jgi:hypothetical protein
MAKHSHIEDQKRARPGRAADDPVAYYYRNNPSLDEALAEVAAQFVRDSSLKIELKAIIGQVRRGLRENSPKGGLDVLDGWLATVRGEEGVDALSRSSANSRVVLAAELEFLVPRLVHVYTDPRDWFGKVLPKERPGADFTFTDGLSEDTLETWPYLEVEDLVWLAHLFRTWGLGVILNPDVHRFFSSLPSGYLSYVLGRAEIRPGLRDGRPRGRADGATSSRARVDHGRRVAQVAARKRRLEEEYGYPPKLAAGKAVTGQAAAEDRKPSTIKKSRQRAKKVP